MRIFTFSTVILLLIIKKSESIDDEQEDDTTLKVHSKNVCTDAVTQLKLTAYTHVTEYLVGETVNIQVRLSGETEDPIRVRMRFNSHLPHETLYVCHDCLEKILNLPEVSEFSPENRVASFCFTAIVPVQMNVYFEIERAGIFLMRRQDTCRPLPIQVDLSEANVSLHIGRASYLYYLNAFFGWGYLVAWAIGLYPQLIFNCMRKSCEGLNLDLLVITLTGFVAYAIFNVCFFFVPFVQNEFVARNPYNNIPVQLNDVVYALHHLFIIILFGLQCIYYKTSGVRMSMIGLLTCCGIYASAILLGYYVFIGAFSVLDYLYFFSYVKLWLTFSKYVPQGLSHYRNKNTENWSVYYSFFDLIGGVFSLFQTFVLIYNYDDWSFLTRNLAKFGISLIAITFNGLFNFQHFFLYPVVKKPPTNTRLNEQGHINMNFLHETTAYNSAYDKSKY